MKVPSEYNESDETNSKEYGKQAEPRKYITNNVTCNTNSILYSDWTVLYTEFLL